MAIRNEYVLQRSPARAGRSRIVLQLLKVTSGVATLGLVTWWGFALGASSLSIGLIFICVVFIVALRCGFWQASITSIVAVALLDYFFLPPLLSFRVAGLQEVVALSVFEMVAVTVSRISARELKHQREVAIHRNGMAQLYELSRCSLLLDMHQPPGPQLVVLIQRTFGAKSVALYDLNLGRQDRAGEWGEGEEDYAKQCYLRNASATDREAELSERVLLSGSGPIGALVIRGGLDPLVVDAVAALAEIALDRHEGFEKEERAESARKSEELRTAVMDALAHELKTPLTAVQTASAGLLAIGGLTKPQSNLAVIIEAESIRLNELCTRLLKAAKVEADRVGLKPEEFEIEQLINEIVGSARTDAERDRVLVSVEEPRLSLIADRELLRMILTQYIDNARKYATPGTPIEVKAWNSHTEVIVSVHNVGPTIRIEDRERIFDRFYRAAEINDAVPGSGIGLSVAKKAAEAHHGHVWVISDDAEGTTFFLSLPRGTRRDH